MSFFVTIAYAAESANQAASSGIGSLGFDWKVLLFQIINFALLIFLLRWLAYKPITQILDQRKEKIEASLRTADAIEAKQDEILKKERELLAEAKQRADSVLADSQKQAETIISQAEARADERSRVLLREAEQQITHQMSEAQAKLSKEMRSLVAQATGKVIGQKLDGPADEALIRSAIKKAEGTQQ